MKLTKNIASVLLLVIFFGGFIWLIGNVEQRKLTETINYVETQAGQGVTIIGPVTVDHSSCRYLFPSGGLEMALQRLICSDCMAQAMRFKSNYDAQLLDDHCARRGTNSLIFRHKQSKLPESND